MAILRAPLVAAGVIKDSLGREWDATKHPRGRDGKFIHTFKLIHAFMDAVDTEPWMSGTVTQINDDGSIRVKITKTVDPNLVDPYSGQTYVGHEVDIPSGNVESVNEKAMLKLDMWGKPEPKGAGDATHEYDFSTSNFNEFGKRAGLSGNDIGHAVQDIAAFKEGNKFALKTRSKYHVALYAKSVSGDNREFTDAQYAQFLDEIGVDPDIIDDTPDGMSGLKWLADQENASRSPDKNLLDNESWLVEQPPLHQGTIREATIKGSENDVRLAWFDDGTQGLIDPNGNVSKHNPEDGSLIMEGQYAVGNIDVPWKNAEKPPEPEDMLTPGAMPDYYSKDLSFTPAKILGGDYPNFDAWTVLDIDGTTSEEAQAAYNYSHNNVWVNSSLRGGYATEGVEAQIANLDSLFTKSSTKMDMQVDRTILGNPDDEHIQQLALAAPGTIVHDAGYSGTTVSGYSAGMPYGHTKAGSRIRMIINVPQGSPAIYLDQVSWRKKHKGVPNSHEKELLLPRGSRFEVVHKTSGDDDKTDLVLTVNLLPPEEVNTVDIPDVEIVPEPSPPAVSQATFNPNAEYWIDLEADDIEMPYNQSPLEWFDEQKLTVESVAGTKYTVRGKGADLKSVVTDIYGDSLADSDMFYSDLEPTGKVFFSEEQEELAEWEKELLGDNYTPETPQATSAPLDDEQMAIDGEDWASMVDDQGEYRWNVEGKKIRVGDVVTGADGKEFTVHKFEKNNKGVIVKDAANKKYARHRNKLWLKSEPAPTPAPEPEPTPESETWFMEANWKSLDSVTNAVANFHLDWADNQLPHGAKIEFGSGYELEHVNKSDWEDEGHYELYNSEMGELLQTYNPNDWKNSHDLAVEIHQDIVDAETPDAEESKTPPAGHNKEHAVATWVSPQSIKKALQSFLPKISSGEVYDGDYVNLSDGYKLTYEKEGGINGGPSVTLRDPYTSAIDAWDPGTIVDPLVLASEINVYVAKDIEGNKPGFVEAGTITGGEQFDSAAELTKINNIPKNIPGVKQLFPNMGVVETKNYRNAGYALNDAADQPVGSDSWLKAVNKALYNLEKSGADGKAKLQEVLDWKTKSIEGESKQPEKLASTMPSIYVPPPPGATILGKYQAAHTNSSPVYALEYPDGVVHYHHPTGTENKMISSPEFIKELIEDPDSPGWHAPTAEEASWGSKPAAAAPDLYELPPGYAPMEPGSTALYKFNGGTQTYISVRPNGKLTYHYSDGEVYLDNTDTEVVLTGNPMYDEIWKKDQQVPAAADPSFEFPAGASYGPLAAGSKIYGEYNEPSIYEAPVYMAEAPDGILYYVYPNGQLLEAKTVGNTDTNEEYVASLQKNSSSWTIYDAPKIFGGATPEKMSPSRQGADGKPMHIGDTVVSTNAQDSKVYKVVKFENNDYGVIVESGGKKYARNRKNLKLSSSSTPAPAAPSVAPKKPIIFKPITQEVDKDSPWYGEDKKPVKPVKPDVLTPDTWVPEGWLDQAEANWKAKTTSTNKAFSDTIQYKKYVGIANDGDVASLTWLQNEGFLTQELFDAASKAMDDIHTKNKIVEDQYNTELSAWAQDMQQWNIANGQDPNAFPGAPKSAKEIFQGGTPNWTQAYPGTPAAADVLDAMRTADENLARRGTSIYTDSDQIEDLDVRINRVIDETGAEKLEAKFKLTAWAGDALKESIEKRTGVETDYQIATKYGEVDPDTGLLKYFANKSTYASQGTTYKYTDPDTGAVVQVLRADVLKTKSNQNSLHNQVRIYFPPDVTPEQYQKTLENLGIANSAPAAPKDVELYVKNKIVGLFGGQNNPAVNPIGEELETKLSGISSQYGVGPENVRIEVNPQGRIKLVFDDETRDKFIKEANIKGFRHNTSAGSNLDNWMKLLTGPIAGLQATYVRWNEGLGGEGSSSKPDMDKGGAEYIFTKPYHNEGTPSGNYFMVHPKAALRRTDIHGNEDDVYGTQSGYHNVHDIMKWHPYEITFKQAVPLQDIWYVRLDNDALRNQIIQALKNRGIYEINGIPVEDFIVGSGMVAPTVDETQWSSNHLPPAIAALIEQLT